MWLEILQRDSFGGNCNFTSWLVGVAPSNRGGARDPRLETYLTYLPYLQIWGDTDTYGMTGGNQ